jgi:uncharacterized repeat protein (TIGR02543 family)
MTVYALWDIQTCTVEFDANGGFWYDITPNNPVSPYTKTVIHPPVGKQIGPDAMPKDPTQEVASYPPAENPKFTGWNTKKDGTGSNVSVSTVANGNMTVYAQWKAPGADNPAEKPSGGGGTGPSTTPSAASGDNPLPAGGKSAGHAIGAVQKTVYIERGKSAKLPFVAYAPNDGKTALKWKASRKAVASVKAGKASGKISANANKNSLLSIKAGKRLGTSKITLSSKDGGKLTVTVKVIKKPRPAYKTMLRLKDITSTMEPGQTAVWRASLSKNSTAIIKLKSSNPKVATVDAAGKVTALSSGYATISAYAGGLELYARIAVTPAGGM